MIPTSRTSIVYNTPSKLLGLPPYYYRLRACDTNLTSNTPADQYQRLKLIQNTVRVYGSLYTANLGPLSAYQNPGLKTHNVCWNQMSDRAVPSVQKTVVPSGTNSALNKKTTSVTSSRPGCQSPGGVGCDIKHNSYDRYLNRLKGKGPLRRGVVPPNFGAPVIPFNPAYPIYGAKTMKTNIVTGCNCKQDSTKIYSDPLYQSYPKREISFNVGEYVFAIQYGDNYYTRAIILQNNDDFTYLVQFDNETIETHNVNTLLLYYPCNCNGEINSQVYPSGFLVTNSSPSETCLYPTYIPNQPVL
jgi:hypothetical protein